MKTNKIEMILGEPKSLTELVKTAAKTVMLDQEHGMHQLVLRDPTKNQRRINIIAFCNYSENIIKKLALRIFDTRNCNSTYGPDGAEILYLLKNFNGDFRIEYEYPNDGETQNVITHDNLNLPDEKKMSAYIDTRERVNKFNPSLQVGMHSKNQKWELALVSAGGKAEGSQVWWLSLTESRPFGPFAERRMNRLNRYFEKYVEPYIVSSKWTIYWPK